RDLIVTGVQTCALPILPVGAAGRVAPRRGRRDEAVPALRLDLDQRLRDRPAERVEDWLAGVVGGGRGRQLLADAERRTPVVGVRSEERRVGKECRSRGG